MVGAVNDIDMDRYKDKLSDYGLDGVLQAEGFGVFGAKDVRGMGYTILIDGLVRDGSNSVASLSDMLNADEVEQHQSDVPYIQRAVQRAVTKLKETIEGEFINAIYADAAKPTSAS